MWASALKSFSSNITSHYKLPDTPTIIAGPWRIYDSKHKTSGKAVSVFVFDKKSLEPQSGGLGGRSSNTSLKKAQEEVIDRLKREANSLARLRHPSILELAEPVEETRNGGCMFATEPVTATLASLLSDKDDQERSAGAGGRSSRYVVDEGDGRGKQRRDIELDQLEMQKGLLQIGKGLEFLHESAGLVHGNLVPEAIFVNAKGDWKISGLGFSGKNEESTSASASTQPAIALSELLNHDPRLPNFAQLNLDYSSPDFVIDNSVTAAADMFALGLIIVALYNSPHKSPLETNQSISTFKRIFASASSSPSHTNNYLSSTALPRDVMTLLPRLLARRSAQRLTAKDFQNAQFFDNILVSTLRFLESLPAKTPNEKSMFLRGLPRILSQFPKSVLEKKVLPALLEEMKDKELIAQVLQNVFAMMKYMPNGKRAFTEKIIPRLREIFLNAGASGKAVAPQPEKDTAKAAGLMILLENIQTIADNTNGKQFEEDIWPIIKLSMESPAHSLIDTALRTLSVMLSVLDFPTIKNDVFPVIASVFSKTNSLGIKIRGLEALQTLCGGSPGQDDFSSDGLDGLPQESKAAKKNVAILDKYTIQEKVVPLLKAIKTKEPAVMLAALEVFKEVGKIADADYLATEALPVLWSFSLGPLLNLSQFQAFMALIQTYTQRIVSEQTRKLNELSATQAPVQNRSDFMTFARVSQVNGMDNGASVSEGDFESLVLGRIEANGMDMNSGSSGTNPFDAWSNTPAPTTRVASPPHTTKPAVTPGTQAPTFSWSTPAPSMQTTLQPTQPSSLASYRTVTPDQSLNSFSTMKPMTVQQSSSLSSFSQPLQPAQPSLTPISPVNSSFASPPTTSQGIDWTSASATSSSNIWATPTPQPSTFGSTTLPSRPMQQQQSAFSIAPPPPTSPYSSFSIAPPPAGGSVSRQPSYQSSVRASGGFDGSVLQPQQAQGQQQSIGQQPPGQKSGLDKYESLI